MDMEFIDDHEKCWEFGMKKKKGMLLFVALILKFG